MEKETDSDGLFKITIPIVSNKHPSPVTLTVTSGDWITTIRKNGSTCTDFVEHIRFMDFKYVSDHKVAKDLKTNLIWARPYKGPPEAFATYNEAEKYLSFLKISEFIDWRMPTCSEIKEIKNFFIKDSVVWSVDRDPFNGNRCILETGTKFGKYIEQVSVLKDSYTKPYWVGVRSYK